MTQRHEQREREEAIVPVARSSARLEPGGGPKPPRPRVPLVAVIGALLLVLVVVVFGALPRWVEQDAERRAAEPESEAPVVAPAEPAFTPEELEALREEAEALLADLLQQQDRLEDRSVSSWGGDTWEQYDALAKRGDDAYLADDYARARTDYQGALELGRSLLERSREIMQSALAAGEQAFEAGNAALAIQQFDIVLGVDPDDDAARFGRARAERLPEVLELVRRGNERRQAGDLGAARDDYRAALEIDPEWSPARGALDEVTAAISTSRFDNLVSAGFAAIADEDYTAAREHFAAALAVRPGSDVARDGLIQAEQGERLDTIALAEVRGAAFETRELWQQAIEQYTLALDVDPTVAFALEGLERAQARADLDRKLENLIENPNLLLTDTVLAEAERLLADARARAGPGTRLADQVDRLAELVEVAARPVTVRLVSDQLTEVTIYRVGRLGVFLDREIAVRPGSYTAVGSRDGYRDVRTTFTVLPGREPGPVTIVCEEPI